MSTGIHPTKKIAIMGGTFDPIHIGHLVTAEAVRHEFDIDEVLFVPTGNPPHKPTIDVTTAEHRYLMAVLATAANPQFNVSRIEIDREGVTYTIDTIKELKELYGQNAKLFFITGADAINEILTWKDPKELLHLCTFVAVTRPGYNKRELFERVEELKKQFSSSIRFLEVPALAISSSDIRERAKQNHPIKYLVTEAVEHYINKNKLYIHQISFNKEIIHKMNIYVKNRMSEKRFSHTKHVVQMALELAKIHEVNTDEIFVAALFHDVAKELSAEEKRQLCEQYKIKLDAYEVEHIDIVHGKIGAAILEKDWGIKHEGILNSIKYHTIGRPKMTDLEKIIYLSDMIEYSREPFNEMEEMRRLSAYDLNKAMYKALKVSEHYVCDVLKQVPHPITKVLIEEYKMYHKV